MCIWREWCIVYNFGTKSEIVLASFAKKTNAKACLEGFHETWAGHEHRFTLANRTEVAETEELDVIQD